MADAEGPDESEFAAAEPSLDAMRDALDRLDETDDDWADLQWHVATLLQARYHQNADADDLDDAILRARAVVAGPKSGKPEYLAELALMLWDRFDPDDLGEYCRLFELALEQIGESGDAEFRAECQANLAVGLMNRRPEPTGADRARALELLRSAAESGAVDPDTRRGVLTNLAETLSHADASLADLEDAVRYARQAIDEKSPDSRDTANSWSTLSHALDALHDQRPDPELIVQAVDAAHQALANLDGDDPDFPVLTATLVGLMRQRFHHTTEPKNLVEGLRLLRQFPSNVVDAHPDRAFILAVWAGVASDLAHHLADRNSARESLDRYESAIAAADPVAADTGRTLASYSAALRVAADLLSDPALIDRAIERSGDALLLLDRPSLFRAAALTTLCTALRDRYATTRSLEDLDQATTSAYEAVSLTPDTHREYPARLTNLVVTLSDNFDERANLSDLDRAIGLYRGALACEESVAIRVAERRNDLALALRARFETTLDRGDLDESIALSERAVQDTDSNSVMWPGFASNLGNALVERYEITASLEDLDASIEFFADALSRAGERVAEMSGYASNLGLALTAKAHHTGLVTNFNEAIRHLTTSVEVLPDNHADAASRLSNLGDAYRQRAVFRESVGEMEAARADIAASIDTSEHGIAIAGDSDPRLLPALANLARALRYSRTLDPDSVSLGEILDVQRRAAALSEIPAAHRFAQSALWAEDAEAYSAPGEALSAHRQAVELTTEVAWVGMSLGERRRLLEQLAGALVSAVRFAVAQQQYGDALAWADQIRSVLWRQTMHVRSAQTAVGSVDLSPLLGLASVTDRQVRERRRSLAHDAGMALTLDAAGSKAYDSLSLPGTLVLLIPGEESSTALLVGDSKGSRTVELPRVGADALAQQTELFRKAAARQTHSSESTFGDARRQRHEIFDCLGWLWDCVAAPILADVPDSVDLARIWWSPIGDFSLLPLHAAGHYPRTLQQLVEVDSTEWTCVAEGALNAYLPTVLVSEPRRTTKTDRSDRRLLYVATDTEGNLDAVPEEYTAMSSAVGSVTITELLDTAATVNAVRDAINTHQFLHVSAHGHLGDDETVQSGFRLHDGVFALGEFAECDVPDAQLAVFLTCDSATGDIRLPNEALHMAGAARQAGFRHTVAATMPMRDSSAIPVVASLYQALDSAEDSAIGDVVIRALHASVGNLRKDPRTALDPFSWAPYAVFGWGCDVDT